jgi:hypothetical protein
VTVNSFGTERGVQLGLGGRNVESARAVAKRGGMTESVSVWKRIVRAWPTYSIPSRSNSTVLIRSPGATAGAASLPSFSEGCGGMGLGADVLAHMSAPNTFACYGVDQPQIMINRLEQKSSIHFGDLLEDD